MNDEQITQKGGSERDIGEYAKQNGADLTEKDFKKPHTGQGQIIEGGAIQQDENGNWVEAPLIEYYPLKRKILCFIGWHEWSFLLQRNAMGFFLPEKIDAKCIWCNKKF